MKRVRFPVLLLLALFTLLARSYSPTGERETTSPDLDHLLESLERVAQQNTALSRPYELIREYKAFRADDKQPTAEVIAQINFAPPNVKTFKLTQTSGNKRAERIVRDLLEQEVESARELHKTQIDRMNYDFVLLRQENFGSPEYVLRIVPKRQQKGLILGQIWVDANTFRIRRIEGVPVKNPSFWIKNIHITLQFAQVNQMWISVSFDAIATVRLLGLYTLTSRYLGARDPASISALH